MAYIPKEKFKLLKKILENNPDGVEVSVARKETHLCYGAIQNKVGEWGYKIEKKRIKVSRLTNVIVKKDISKGEQEVISSIEKEQNDIMHEQIKEEEVM